MKLDELYPSKYLKASDLEGDTTLTIAGVTTESMKTKDGAEEEKPVLLFSDSKPMVMNVTNARAIQSLYGDETDAWTGKPVTLYTAEVAAFGETTQAIRIRDAKALQRKAESKPAIVSDKAKAVKAFNAVAIAAKAAGFESLVSQYRPAKDAGTEAILKSATGLQAHLEAETQAEPDFA